MMNKIISGIILNLLFFTFETNAQKFKIISAEDGAALPFATLINFTHPNLVSSNTNGIAELTAQNGDSIAVSYVGFKTRSFVFNTDTSTTIQLLKETVLMPPVTVQKCKKERRFSYINKTVNYTLINGVRHYFDGLAWWGVRWKNSEYAVRINPEKENTRLESFSFWLNKSAFGPKSAINAPLIISFYDVNDSITPGNLRTETPLFYYPQKTGKQTLNLDSLHLSIPPNGIYISFQCVTNEDYAWTQPIKMSGSGSIKDTVIKCYGGTIEGVYSSDFELACFNPIKNKWFLFPKKTGEGDLHPSVKYSSIIHQI